MALFVHTDKVRVQGTYGQPVEDAGIIPPSSCHKVAGVLRCSGLVLSLDKIRPSVHAPVSGRIIDLDWNPAEESYSIVLESDEDDRQHRLAGIHVPALHIDDRVTAGEPLGQCRGVSPIVTLQEASGYQWAPGKVREPRLYRVEDSYWDVTHRKLIRSVIGRIDQHRSTYSYSD